MGFVHEIVPRFSFRYRGPGDFATVGEVADVGRLKDAVLDALGDADAAVDVKGHADFVRWMEARKLSKLRDAIDVYKERGDIPEPLCDAAAECCDRAKDICEESNKGAVVAFLNENLPALLDPASDDSPEDMLPAVVEVLLEFKKGIRAETLQELIEKRCFILILHHDKFLPLLRNNRLAERFLEAVVEDARTCPPRFESALRIAIVLGRDGEFKEKADWAFGELLSICRTGGAFGASALPRIIAARDAVCTLKAAHDGHAGDFEALVSELEGSLRLEMGKGGHPSSTKVDLSPVFETLKDESAPFESRMVTAILFPLSAFPSEGLREGPLGFVTQTEPKSDERFTRSYQMRLRLALSMGSHIVGGILDDDDLRDGLFRWLEITFNLVQTRTGSPSWERDFLLLLQFLSNLSDAMGQDDLEQGDLFLRTQSIGAMSFIYGFLEKAMRHMASCLLGDSSLAEMGKTTMGRLTENEKVRRALTGELCSAVEFVLSCNPNTMVGMNRRNRLAHWNDPSDEEIGCWAALEAAYLLLAAMTMSTLFFLEQEKPGCFGEDEAAMPNASGGILS